jgi:glutaminyl-peptide cyclotransferase
MKQKYIAGFLVLILVAASIVYILRERNPADPGGNTDPVDVPAVMGYSIVATYPHDTTAFTEGLLFYKGDLYEGTGENGESKLMKVDLKTGKALRSMNLDKEYFGEGILIINDTVYQLTYREHKGFMYSLKDFKKLKEFPLATEGWGMTTNGKEIIVSDGSSNLYYYQPGTFNLLHKQEITEAGSLRNNINELEYIDGFIYANQYLSNYILKIDTGTGKVVAKADLSDVDKKIKAAYPPADVLNGIAYDAATGKIYVTGKNWPELYEIKFN